MREYVVNRPDAGAMRTLLERESDPEGLIVRLAWLAGFAYRQEIARLLHVQPKQCTLILKRMVTSGEIAKQGQKYLPQEQKAE